MQCSAVHLHQSVAAAAAAGRRKMNSQQSLDDICTYSTVQYSTSYAYIHVTRRKGRTIKLLRPQQQTATACRVLITAATQVHKGNVTERTSASTSISCLFVVVAIAAAKYGPAG